jgi:hypothetical protein
MLLLMLEPGVPAFSWRARGKVGQKYLEQRQTALIRSHDRRRCFSDQPVDMAT